MYENFCFENNPLYGIRIPGIIVAIELSSPSQPHIILGGLSPHNFFCCPAINPSSNIPNSMAVTESQNQCQKQCSYYIVKGGYYLNVVFIMLKALECTIYSVLQANLCCYVLNYFMFIIIIIYYY